MKRRVFPRSTERAAHRQRQTSEGQEFVCRQSWRRPAILEGGGRAPRAPVAGQRRRSGILAPRGCAGLPTSSCHTEGFLSHCSRAPGARPWRGGDTGLEDLGGVDGSTDSLGTWRPATQGPAGEDEGVGRFAVSETPPGPLRQTHQAPSPSARGLRSLLTTHFICLMPQLPIRETSPQNETE